MQVLMQQNILLVHTDADSVVTQRVHTSKRQITIAVWHFNRKQIGHSLSCQPFNLNPTDDRCKNYWPARQTKRDKLRVKLKHLARLDPMIKTLGSRGH